ncbi:histidine kinase [Methylococcus sp. EFPC2]|uniref:histidine kinase n=1 Tax=Methylococcus sp. EFPC2 TaxID=2812648 RepID=UPI0019680203|nr:histidine kinase [Methylococcus sp. EFPC2]QSA97381.1 methanol utilization protein MoxY [Methylococcus sp. EFPC2]
MTLRTRLYLTLALTLIVILSMGAAFSIHHGRQAVESEIRSSVELALHLMDAGSPGQPASEEAYSRWLLPLAQSQSTRHLRIQVLRNGQAVVATPPPASATDSAPAWFARWVTPTPQWVERSFPLPNGVPVRVVIQADPQAEIAEVWEESLGFLELLGLLAVAIYGIIHIMLGRAFRSVGVILRGLEGIETGDYGARLPHFALPEFASIADTFNHMAAALEKARQENRTLTQRSLAIQEEERRYIAQELHDELGQSLSAIKVLAVSVRAMVPLTEGREALATIAQTCDQLFEVVRSLMRRLRPVMLEDLGLTASLEDLIAYWKARHPDCAVTFHCEPAVEASAGTAKIHLYRIVQECLTNVSRHAGANTLRIRLTAPEAGGTRTIHLDFADDGQGFDATRPPTGFGLYGIRERALSLGGKFVLGTQPGRGVRISVTLPCKSEDDSDE